MKQGWYVMAAVAMILAGCGEKQPAPKPAKAVTQEENTTRMPDGNASMELNATQIAALAKENRALTRRVAQLETQLDEVTQGPSRRLEKGQLAWNAGDRAKARKILTELVKSYPDTPEAAKAKGILAKIRRQYQQKLDGALEGVQSLHEPDGTIWYYDAKTEFFPAVFYLYIGSKPGEPPRLFWRFQYADTEPLELEKILVRADWQGFSYEPHILELKKQNDSGGFRIWYDGPMTPKEERLVKGMLEAKEPMVVFQGKSYFEERPLTRQEQDAIKRMQRLFILLGEPYR